MSFLMIYNCHSGEVLKTPKPLRYHTVNDFKQFIYESLTNYLIEDVENIFLLTSFGIKLNFGIINEINEVYVFDKRMFNNAESLVTDYFESSLGNFNNLMLEYKQLRDESVLPDVHNSNIKTMTSNLKRFQSWSQTFLNHCLKVNDLIKNHYMKQLNNIFKSLNVIFQFINNFVNDIEKSFNGYYNFIKLLNYKSLHKTWAQYYTNIKKFPSVKFKSSNEYINLVNLLDYDRLVSSSKFIGEKLPIILTKFNDMIASLNDINKEKVSIDRSIETERNESIKKFRVNIAEGLVKEFKNKVNEISRSLESFDSSNDSIAQIYSSTQKGHKELLHMALKINDSLNTVLNFKLSLLNSSFKIFNKISNLQIEVVNIKNDLKVLSQPSPSAEVLSNRTITQIKGAEDYLSLTIDLPLLFGFVLIEKRRQFEWYDFYSKGIINNATEQLVTIIDHEKIFQKLWLKKFGSFLSLLDKGNVILKPALPNLDITLIHNQSQQSIFLMVKDITIERDDLLEYLKLTEVFVQKHYPESNNKFSEHLNKTFKDLVKSTNNMKSVTKLISSISSFTSPKEDLSNSKLKRIIENDEEFNENLIKGLKTRIRKLEDLLHQQQFKNLANWPVTRGYSSPKGGPSSPFPTSPPPQRTQSLGSVSKGSNQSPNLNIQSSNALSPITSGNKTNPTSLLRKDSLSAPLDASITIDKHLDNLRLRKENKELSEDNQRLTNDNVSKSLEIERLLNEIENLKAEKGASLEEIKKLEVQHTSEVDKIKEINNTQISSMTKEINELKEQLTHTRSIINEYKLINESKDREINSFDSKLDSKLQKIKDLMHIKDDLISNMTAKELEYVKSSNNYEQEIKDLKIKVEEISEDYENLIELTEQQSDFGIIHELNEIIKHLIIDVKNSLELNYEFFYEFCLVLESIGLLLLKEYNQETHQEEYKITRVKGLRSKKSEDPNTTNGDISIVSIENKPSSKVVDEINSLMRWVQEIKLDKGWLDGHSNDDVKSLSTNADENNEMYEEKEVSAQLIGYYNQYFKPNHEHSSDFERFIETVSFNSGGSEKFFLSAIAKRFRDVEGFAKKLTKENKLKLQELNKLAKSSSSKISMNNFAVGDLALFLPTRIESLNEVKLTYQPWAAFNIGAPHFFLNNLNKSNDNLNNKEWLVAKIINIKEFKVDETNINDEQGNPYKLSLGINWYLIEAREEIIS
ncbi:oligomeric, coiled-coil, peripheral membrane protein [Yamadazyma tenuis]|uniref:oligomeric, coiled-coil, peripheral membrane protein n=1 Tax=Candida tenuis TaxID=2315449 RepID=UPI00279D3D64|nr:oligomeric, coiled-coil, peripheral membrane protein [Yamadazyma tenuis]